MALSLYNRGQLVPIKQWKFPCGEVGVKLEGEIKNYTYSAKIMLDWEGNDDLMALGQLVDICRNEGLKFLTLEIPYFPYSRQDRRCHQGESFALSVVADYINNMQFERVITWDAHSDVLGQLVANLKVVPQWQCAFGLPAFDYYVSPDAGALKKIMEHPRVNASNVIHASKVRQDGGVVSQLPENFEWLIAGKNVVVIDDLCDGGATFIDLGKKIWQGAPASVSLYVTHGFFTKGVEALRPLYDNIYTANLKNPSVRGLVKEI